MRPSVTPVTRVRRVGHDGSGGNGGGGVGRRVGSRQKRQNGLRAVPSRVPRPGTPAQSCYSRTRCRLGDVRQTARRLSSLRAALPCATSSSRCATGIWSADIHAPCRRNTAPGCGPRRRLPGRWPQPASAVQAAASTGPALRPPWRPALKPGHALAQAQVPRWQRAPRPARVWPRARARADAACAPRWCWHRAGCRPAQARQLALPAALEAALVMSLAMRFVTALEAAFVMTLVMMFVRTIATATALAAAPAARRRW